MACFKPLKGYRSKEPNPSGKYSITFNESQGDSRLEIACGQCIGCRLNRSKNWAIRCMHESTLYEDNCFVTLTYSPDELPPHSSLQIRHFQNFFKRLRKYLNSSDCLSDFPSLYERKVRYFHCGEYGETSMRPHYHACLFNLDFPDKQLYKIENNNKLYNSHLLDKLWGHGFATIGALTFESAAYVARYILKKVNGREAENYYSTVDETTGEILPIQPEYVTMSRRPGIGKAWFEKYSSDLYPDDFVILRGKKMATPKFYDKQLEKLNPGLFNIVKQNREVSQNPKNNTPARLAVREEIVQRKMKDIKRKFESGN